MRKIFYILLLPALLYSCKKNTNSQSTSNLTLASLPTDLQSSETFRRYMMYSIALKTGEAPFAQENFRKTWRNVRPYPIGEFISGGVRVSKDYRGIVKTLWDESNLYFLVEIQDNNKLWQNAFVDYGWIEDDKGEKVWIMSDINAEHAGGALKNQRVSADVYLKPGKYKLRYVTDESHAFDSWNDSPPKTSFYGIILSKKQ